MPKHDYHVYILTNRSGTLYTGVTDTLVSRVFEHKQRLVPGFTAWYRIDWLAYFEQTTEVRAEIAREKQIKGRTRGRKVALVESVNPGWTDLSEGRYEQGGRTDGIPVVEGSRR